MLLICKKLEVEKYTYFFWHSKKYCMLFNCHERSEQFPSFLFMQLLKFIYQGNKQKSHCLSLTPWILHENCIIHMFILLSKATCVAIYLIYCNHLIYSFCIRSDHIGKTIWKKKQNPRWKRKTPLLIQTKPLLVY